MKRIGINESMERIGINEYFMSIAEVVSSRSTCIKRKVGAVLVRNKQVLSTGYNGCPKGLPHCDEVGCVRKEKDIPSGERHELCRGVHAEQNTIIQSAVHNTSTKNTTLYSTHYPCTMCTKIIINARVSKVIYKDGYPDDLAKKLFRRSDVEVEKYEEE